MTNYCRGLKTKTLKSLYTYRSPRDDGFSIIVISYIRSVYCNIYKTQGNETHTFAVSMISLLIQGMHFALESMNPRNC